MRRGIIPGGVFPDYELPDHTGERRKLSELQGDDPLILTLAHGHYCPKEHQQHLELAAFYHARLRCSARQQRTSHALRTPGECCVHLRTGGWKRSSGDPAALPSLRAHPGALLPEPERSGQCSPRSPADDTAARGQGTVAASQGNVARASRHWCGRDASTTSFISAKPPTHRSTSCIGASFPKQRSLRRRSLWKRTASRRWRSSRASCWPWSRRRSPQNCAANPILNLATAK